MNKITLLLIAIFSYLSSPLAFSNTENNYNTTLYSYNNGEKFTFVERGITFSVFRNGEFDFYINPRNGVRTNIDIGLVNISYNYGYNYDAYVQYDDYGAILQIENVPIYYDYYGRIVGAGNVKINYRANRLARIGGLHIYYNTYGYYSHYSGFINTYNRYYAYHPHHNYFVRPYYNHCVVSYNPYRLYYKPKRYNYYDHRKYYAKNYNKNRTYKKVDSRVRNARSGDSYQKRSTHDRYIRRNNNVTSSQKLRRNIKSNNDSNIRTRGIDKKQYSKQNVQSARNSGSGSEFRVSQDIRNERSTVSQKRNENSRIAPGKSLKRNEIIQNRSGKHIKSHNKSISKRNVTQRSSSRNENYKQSKVKGSIRKTNTNSRAKNTVASRSNTKRKTL